MSASLSSAFVDVLSAKGPAYDRADNMSSTVNSSGPGRPMSSPTGQMAPATPVTAKSISAGCSRGAPSRMSG